MRELVISLRLVCACGALLAGALPASGAAPGKAPSPAAHVVTIESMTYRPALLTVRRGDRIRWTNRDLVPHTVTEQSSAAAQSGVASRGNVASRSDATSQAGMFDSKAIAPNASWSWVADTPGTYSYVCMFHPTMKASLRVLP